MMETIAQAFHMMDDMKIPDEDFHREGNLSWDSHTIRDKLAYNPSSKLLIGYAEDAFDLDIIVQQFKQMQDAAVSFWERFLELSSVVAHLMAAYIRKLALSCAQSTCSLLRSNSFSSRVSRVVF